mgnify:CR=1 FL=1
MSTNDGDSRVSSTSFLYASPMTRAVEPLTLLDWVLRPSAIFWITKRGIDVLMMPASSMNRVGWSTSRAFQDR